MQALQETSFLMWGLLVYNRHMSFAPKVMPPIYFHGNYNRYKEHNTIWQRKFSATKHCFQIYLLPLAMLFCQPWRRACMLQSWKTAPAEVTNCFTAAMTSSLLKQNSHCPTVLTSTVWSPSIFSKHEWMSMGAIFSSWGNSVTHLCFVCTSVSDTIFSDCPSAATCGMAAMCNRILARRFNFYCRINTLEVVDQHNQMGGITFWEAFIYKYIFIKYYI